MVEKNTNGKEKLCKEQLKNVSGGAVLKKYLAVNRNQNACELFSSVDAVAPENPKCGDCRSCMPGKGGFYCQNRYS